MSSCASVAIAITSGSRPLMPGRPIGQVRRAASTPSAARRERKRARLVLEPISPTKRAPLPSAAAVEAIIEAVIVGEDKDRRAIGRRRCAGDHRGFVARTTPGVSAISARLSYQAMASGRPAARAAMARPTWPAPKRMTGRRIASRQARGNGRPQRAEAPSPRSFPGDGRGPAAARRGRTR